MNFLFSNRSYRSLFFATGISNLGNGVAALAFPWLASLMMIYGILRCRLTKDGK